MINFTPSLNQNKFYMDGDLIRLVEISLENFNNIIFEDILALIRTNNINIINSLFKKFESNYNDSNEEIYEELNQLINNIYSKVEVDNLRGSFLELIVFKLLDMKYDIILKNFLYGIDGYVWIKGVKCKRTVDIFVMCDFFKGFVCECKINAEGFESHDINNLNDIFIASNEILSPYVISLSSESFINEKLSELYHDDFSNAFVHGQYIKIISLDNFIDFFS